MEKDKKEYYIDMSLMRNQYKVANIISGLLSLEELESLIQLKSSFYENTKRDYSIPIITIIDRDLEKYNFKILDIVTVNKERFIDLRISLGKAFQIDFKMKRTKNTKYYIASACAAAINFIKYKDKYDQFIIKPNIINNFADLLSSFVDMDTLEELKYVSDLIMIDKDIIEKDSNEFKFSTNNIDFKVITDFNIIKFEFKSGDKSDYIYLSKNKVGISNIALIINRAIKNKSR